MSVCDACACVLCVRVSKRVWWNLYACVSNIVYARAHTRVCTRRIVCVCVRCVITRARCDLALKPCRNALARAHWRVPAAWCRNNFAFFFFVRPSFSNRSPYRLARAYFGTAFLQFLSVSCLPFAPLDRFFLLPHTP